MVNYFVKKKEKSTPFDIVVYIILAIFFIVSIGKYDFSGKNALVIFTFFINGIFSYIKIIKCKKNISLQRIYYIFVFIFFFYAPLSQYISGINIWAKSGINITFSHNDYLLANVFIFCFDCFFEMTYFFYKPSKKNVEIKVNNNSPDIYIIFLTVNLLAFGYLIASNNVFSRNELDVASGNLSIQLLNFIKYIPVSSFIILFLTSIKQKTMSKWITLTLIFIIICILYFPFSGSNSRFLIFGCYLCLISMLFLNLKNKSIYFFMFVFGFLFLFSSFNYFKYNKDLNGFKFIQSNLNAEDFDAYQVFMITIKYSKLNGYTYGKNFLSAIFCFIPRSIWNGKSIPSGELIASEFGSSFTNLSCPLIGEWYLSFGFIGILLGGIIIGLLFKYVDNFSSCSILGKGIFCIISGLEIYLIRGALLPTWSYTFALILSLCGMYLLYRILQNIKILK